VEWVREYRDDPLLLVVILAVGALVWLGRAFYKEMRVKDELIRDLLRLRESRNDMRREDDR